MRQYHYYVYILASRTRVLYVGVTSSIDRRVIEHKTKTHEGFTERYNVHRLVLFETFGDIHGAIAREKEIKGWRREKKIKLIESKNPGWRDLAQEWYEEWLKSQRMLEEARKSE